MALRYSSSALSRKCSELLLSLTVFIIAMSVAEGRLIGGVQGAQSAIAKVKASETNTAQTQPRVTLTDLGSLEGGNTVGLAINNADSVVGYRLGDPPEGFYWSARTGFVKILGVQYAIPTDINNRGQVVGSHLAADTSVRGFLWDVKTQVSSDLGCFVPFAINERGDMAGFCRVDRLDQPFVYVKGEYHQRPIENVGASSAYAFDINNRGVVVGTLFFNGPMRAFTSSERTGFVILHPPEEFQVSYAAAINNTGRVYGFVAASNDPPTDPIFGTFRERDGTIESVSTTSSDAEHGVRSGALNSRDWTIRNGSELWMGQDGPITLPGFDGGFGEGLNGLNDRGQVVGYAVDANGVLHLVVWTVRPAKGSGHLAIRDLLKSPKVLPAAPSH